MGPLHEEKIQRNGVSFAANAITYDINHFTEISDEEKNSVWYNKSELRAIRNEAKRMACLSSTSNSEDVSKPNAEPWLRGLEAKTAAGAKKRRQIRINARAAVFLEQEIQDDNGLFDPDTIADTYFEYTERSQVEAQMIAIRDEKEAKEIYDSTKFCDISSAYGKLVSLARVSGSAA